MNDSPVIPTRTAMPAVMPFRFDPSMVLTPQFREK
jgi:hypothetical protein